MGLVDLEMIHQPHDVLDHLDAVGLGIMRFVAQAVTAVVDGDHLIVLGQFTQNAGLPPLQFQVHREAVHQNDRFAFSYDDVANLDPIGVEESIFGGSCHRGKQQDRDRRQQIVTQVGSNRHGISSRTGCRQMQR